MNNYYSLIVEVQKEKGGETGVYTLYFSLARKLNRKMKNSLERKIKENLFVWDTKKDIRYLASKNASIERIDSKLLDKTKLAEENIGKNIKVYYPKVGGTREEIYKNIIDILAGYFRENCISKVKYS
jgi:hypothetical protein